MKSIKSIIMCATIGVASLTFSSCNLDLTPEDNYSSKTFWKTEAQFDGYMVGLRSDLRKKVFHHQYILGESRGGSSKVGTATAGTSINYGVLKTQGLTANTIEGAVQSWGDLYGRITNVNLFIERTVDTDVLPDAKKKSLLAQAYGMRAFWYFDLYRSYGDCPLQLIAKVVNGVVVPEELYEGRAAASVVMAQIKADLQKSYDYFDTDKSFKEQKSTWSKAATEALMADVYLWTAKVTTGDDVANPADIAVAKQHLLNLTTDYGLGLLPSFVDIFPAKEGKGHAESIMAIRYAEGEATNDVKEFVYNWMTSNFNNAWLYEDGTVIKNDTLQCGTAGWQRNEYKNGLFTMMDKKDLRRDATFLSVYKKDDNSLAGTFIRKNIGYYNTSTGSRIFCGDLYLYRYAWVLLALAEVENYEGGDPAKYINMVRERAYGANWNPALHAHVNGSFTDNELAILHEKDKEFVNEGQRWWDLRRMTLTKGGKHLVFCPEGNIDSTDPILDEATESHKVLLPIDVGTLGADPKLKQTVGY